MSRLQLWYNAQPRALRILLAINVVVYLVWNVVLTHIDAAELFVINHVALNPGLPGILFEPWQLLTYSFLHLGAGLGGLLHVGFNMAWMIWIGREYEELYGPGRILGVYILGAIGGALLTVMLFALFPESSLFSGTVHGASGAVLALMTMVAIHQPEKRIGLMFIGVVKLIHIVMAFIALDILFLSAGGTSVSAHLGGIGTGYLLGRVARSGNHPTPWADMFFSRGGRSGPKEGMLARLERRLAEKKGGESDARSDRGATIYQMKRSADSRSDAADSSDSSAEIDRILDKISATGYDSLTEAEKRKLVESSNE